MNEGERPLFRPEALEHYAKARQRKGAPLRLYSAWTRWTFRLVLLLVAGGLIGTIVGRMPEYAEGPAVVWIERTFVTARVPGTVESVEVESGEHVRSGQVLVHLHDAEERAELERVQQAFKLQLVNWLRDPRDEAARQALTTLRTQKQLAEARLDERRICARHAGFVGDIRIRPGQFFAAGDVLLSLTEDSQTANPCVIAMLPAHYGPLLIPGMDLRMELAGHSYCYAEATIELVEHETLGPSAIRRYLGPEVADSVALQGPLVLVRARLTQDTFKVNETAYPFHHGMQGTARVNVRSEPVICTLLPWLRPLFEDRDG